jgi:hypothetical protein
MKHCFLAAIAALVLGPAAPALASMSPDYSGNTAVLTTAVSGFDPVRRQAVAPISQIFLAGTTNVSDLDLGSGRVTSPTPPRPCTLRRRGCDE